MSNLIVNARIKEREAGLRLKVYLRYQEKERIMFPISFFSAQLVTLLLIAQSAESPGESFRELGSLFLWGMLGAIGLAVIVVLIRLKLQSRREAAPDYVSIDPSKHGNQS